MKLRPFCACGCGRLVNSGRYIYTHQNKSNQYALGLKHTKETKRKISEASKGNQYALGYRHTEKTKKRLSEAAKAMSAETRLKISKAGMGRVPTEATRRKISEFHKGKLKSEETKQKVSATKTGVKPSAATLRAQSIARKRNVSKMTKADRKERYGVNRGKKFTEEHRKNKSLAAGGDGSLKPILYPAKFNDELKALIRGRDGGKCQNLGCWGKAKRLSVHHIDYNKNNCLPNNLITVCISCNGRANKGREFWTAFYQEIMRTTISPCGKFALQKTDKTAMELEEAEVIRSLKMQRLKRRNKSWRYKRVV